MRWVLVFRVDGCVSEGDEDRLNVKEALLVAEAIQEGCFFFFTVDLDENGSVVFEL